MTQRGIRYSFLVLLTVLFATLVLPGAAKAQAVRPGCDVQMDRVHNNYYSALRVRNQAMTAQIIVRNDSALAMTCFDQAMAMTSMAGQIFSDVLDLTTLNPALLFEAGAEQWSGSLTAAYLLPPPLGKGGVQLPFPPPWNIMVPAPGITNFLILQINNSVEATLNAMLQNIVGSVMMQLTTALGGVVVSTMTDIAIALLGAIGLGGLVSTFSSALGVSIDLSGFYKQAVKLVMDAILGPGPPQMLRCPNMSTAWSNPAFNGVVGAGITGGVPYMTANNLFTKSFPPGVGGNMNLKLASPGNDAALTQAGTDNTALTTKVGAPPSQQLPATLAPNATVADVINQM